MIEITDWRSRYKKIFFNHQLKQTAKDKVLIKADGK
jgi:hypothetical protein